MIGRPYAEMAWRYRQAGWAGVIPVGNRPGRKSPPMAGYTGWAGADPSGADVQAWINGREGDRNIGLHLPAGIVVPDVDAYNGGDVTLQRLAAEVGHPLPPTWSSTARGEHSPSRHRFYRATLPDGRVWHDHPGGAKGGIDSLHIGHRYAVVWPSTNPDAGNAPYFWYDADGELWEGVPEPSWFTELDPAWVEVLSKPGEPMPGTAADDSTAMAIIRDFRHGPKACYVVRKQFNAEMQRIQGAQDRETAGGLHNPGALYALVALGLEGHIGVRAALSRHQAAYTAARVEYRRESEGAAGADWWRMLRGAVGKWLHAHGDETVPECDCGRPAAGAGADIPGAPGALSASGALDGPSVPDGSDGPDTDGFLWPDDEPTAVPDPDGLDAPTPDEVRAAKIQEQVERLRVRAEATEIFRAEVHARTWTPPVSYGPLSEELELPDDEQRWRFRGMLGVGHNALIVAGRKTGKTTMVGNVIRAYADGKPFLGRFEVESPGAAEPAGVAVFNYEVDERQYRRWLRDVEVINADRVHVLHLRGRTLPLANERVREWVVRWLAERHIGMWIVDPYSRAYVGSVDNGNDEAQVGTFLDTLDVIKAEAGVSELIMPVHTPKARAEAGEETAIGSQRLEGWPDSMWYLTRDLESGARFLRAEGRDVFLAEEQLEYREGDRELLLTGGGNRAEAKRGAVVRMLTDYVASHPGCTGNEVKGALHWGRDTFNEAVKAAGALIRTEPGPNRKIMHFLGSP
jgi:hypothetical protein